jgi:carbohydrate-selective porin OprB
MPVRPEEGRLAFSAAPAIWLLVACALPAYGQDWKDQLARRGAKMTVVYGGTIFSEVAGGIRSGETYSGNLDLELAVDGERLLRTPGLMLFVDGLWIRARGSRSASRGFRTSWLR